MDNKNIYYEWIKEKLKEHTWNHSVNFKVKTKVYYENNKQRLQEQAWD